MPESFKVPGVAKTPPPPDPVINDLIRIETKHFVEVRPAVRGTAVYEMLDQVAFDDVIELEFEDGVRQIIRADQLRQDLRQIGVTRGAEDGALEIPSFLPGPGQTRGEGGGLLSLKFFKVHEVDPASVHEIAKKLLDEGVDKVKKQLYEKFADPVAKIAVQQVLYWLESHLSPGLYHLETPRKFGAEITDQAPFTGGTKDPILLFIHGTASSTAGSFGELTDTNVWSALVKNEQYTDRILALEHRTLSESPIQNAIYVANLLPEQARLHLVTHSRGGLVGELLCMGALDDKVLNAYAQERDDDLDLLRELSGVLKQKEFKVERFVRVACPARGTLLASDRLDRYLSTILSLIGKIPAIAAIPAYPIFEACVKVMVKMRTKPNEVPGLEAQRPESPVIHLLNRSDLKSTADLAVIAGKAEIGGLFRSLAYFASSVFYRQANDFVVNTDSMYGGMSRGKNAYYFLDEGGTVDHFHYFANQVTREQLLAWLAAGPGKAGGAFSRFEFLGRGLIFPFLRGETRLPLLFFVPGLFGTHLGTEGAKKERLWLDDKQLAPGEVAKLGKSSVVVDAGQPDDSARGTFPYRLVQLLNYLGGSYEIAPFAYDWRRRPEEVAGDLQQMVADARKKNPDRTIRFLACGSGGSVVRAMASAAPELWKSLGAKGGRAVVLGLPGTVTATARALAAGEHKLIRLLQMLDRGVSGDLARIFKSFPAIASLAAATDGAAAPEGFCYVAGAGETAAKGTAWYASAPLGNLGEHWPAFEPIRELLANGGTDRLPTRPPSAPAVAESDAADPLLFPTPKAIADAAFEAEDLPSEVQVTLSLSVTHGHLRCAQFPVLVGHYLGDPIVSAEKAIDIELKGALSHRFHGDLYPGAEGTAEIIQAPECEPAGALIIGLDEVGSLKPDGLQRGVSAAALKYALMELERRGSPGACLSLGISSLLVGTDGNALTIRDSIQAITEGVLQANRTLGSLNLWDRVRIEKIEFIDLYLDLAISAAHELCDYADLRRNDPRKGVRIEAAPQISTAAGGQFRRPTNPYTAGWWRRVQVESTKAGFRYTTLTDRARASLETRDTQWALIRHYLDTYGKSTEYDTDLAVVLFETLIPNGLKDRMRDGTSLVLVVNDTSARYPWELLAFRTKEDVRPLASNIGLLRQLVTDGTATRTTRAMAALVVGNPKTEDPDHPSLPRARDEAVAVAEVLKTAGYATRQLLEEAATPLAINAGILGRENRIMHIAGHGHYDSAEPENSGVVIGRGLYLTAKEIASMDLVPELVFLNCCDLGQLGATPHMGGTLAAQLIRLGVKAVIAAGWAINDAAALTFARTFYTEMLQGRKRFGEAVREARKRTREDHPGSNTFAAYQAYGNPDFAFTVGDGGDGRPRRRMVAREEYVDCARNIEAQAREADPEAIAALVEDLSQVRRTLPGYVAKDGEVLAAIGAAFGALGDFPSAIEAYTRALNDPNSKVQVRAAEQLANLQYRHGAKLSDKERDDLVREADRHLEWLRSLGETPERLSLLGSAFKRAARWSTGGVRAKNLRDARKYYAKAYKNQNADTYPAMNEIALRLLLPHDDQEEKKILGLIAEVEEKAQKNLAESKNVWNRAAIPDAMVLRMIIKGELGDRKAQDRLIKEYERALHGATQQEKLSVGNQIYFLRDMLDKKKFGSAIEALSRVITALNLPAA
jgi:tetratricopeptide (TPR) repeat protein